MDIRVQESVMAADEYLATLMSPAQIADKLGWCPKRVRRFIYNGKLPSVKVSGRRFVRREEFETFARKQGVVL